MMEYWAGGRLGRVGGWEGGREGREGGREGMCASKW